MFTSSGPRTAMLERLLLLWLTLLGLLAYFWTAWFEWDPFSGSEPYLDWLIAATMLAIGSLLPRDEVREVVRNWPKVLGGTTTQYVSMPLLAYVVGRLFGFEGATLTGIVMVGCVPGAMASNVLTLAAKANVSYSVSLTTMATLLSPLVVPLALKLTLGQLRLFPREKVIETGLTLLLTVVLPVVVGYAISRCWRRWESAARRFGSAVANLTILWIIAVVVALNRDRLAYFEAAVLAALLVINLAGYAAGYAGGRLLRLPRPMRRALTLEVGMQNAGLGTFLVLKVFDEQPAAAIPTALYTFGCMFTGTILARLWAEFGGRKEDRQ
ncbi:MAG: bile acid:sodium symporter family protein [Planctomycetota bacterium]|jgi:BASS family bile acid:Na+ symporter